MLLYAEKDPERPYSSSNPFFAAILFSQSFPMSSMVMTLRFGGSSHLCGSKPIIRLAHFVKNIILMTTISTRRK